MPADKKLLENRVLETANRLRLIQVDFADKDSKIRNDYLCEEIERALKTILPEERKEFLQKLLERFPTGAFAHQPIIQAQEKENISGIDETKLKDAGFLVQCLLEIIPSLPADQKESIAKRLQQAGLKSQVREVCPDESIEKLKIELQLGDQPDLNADRLLELIALLSDFVYKLEPLGWNTWRRLSPRSKVRQSGELKKTIGQFMGNDPNISGEHVNNELKELMQLIAAVITATSRVGSQFAQRHLAKFSPSEISVLVKMEHKNVFVSHEVKCWRKYCELADKLNEESIETEITKAIVDYVESLVRKMGR
jgi:hypothetical protein